MKVSASILAADLSDLYGSSKHALDAGADMIHLDVMDGHFVPNLTFGAPMASALKSRLSLTIDAHLMISNPEKFAEEFVQAGCDFVAFHAEAARKPDSLIRLIRMTGGRPGMVVSPNTSEETLKPFAKDLDYVLFMSVEPGFAGQKFMPEVVPKLSRFSQWCRAEGLSPELVVDGGVTPSVVKELSIAGATMVVASAAIFRAPDMAEAIRQLKNPS